MVNPFVAQAFVTARYLMDRQPSSLCQAVVTAFMEEGHFAAHIRRMRQTYRIQRDALVAALRRRLGEHLTVEPPDQGGLHEISWQRAALQFTVISDRPVEAMRRFVD